MKCGYSRCSTKLGLFCNLALKGNLLAFQCAFKDLSPDQMIANENLVVSDTEFDISIFKAVTALQENII